MARICESCGRGARMSATRSHSNIASKHRQFVNLQSKIVNGVRAKVCTKCIKTSGKAARVAKKV
jgi:ribosomal protein L28